MLCSVVCLAADTEGRFYEALTAKENSWVGCVRGTTLSEEYQILYKISLGFGDLILIRYKYHNNFQISSFVVSFTPCSRWGVHRRTLDDHHGQSH